MRTSEQSDTPCDQSAKAIISKHRGKSTRRPQVLYEIIRNQLIASQLFYAPLQAMVLQSFVSNWKLCSNDLEGAGISR